MENEVLKDKRDTVGSRTAELTLVDYPLMDDRGLPT